MQSLTTEPTHRISLMGCGCGKKKVTSKLELEKQARGNQNYANHRDNVLSSFFKSRSQYSGTRTGQ